MLLVERFADEDPGAIYYFSASLFAYRNHEKAPPIWNLNAHKNNNKKNNKKLLIWSIAVSTAGPPK